MKRPHLEIAVLALLLSGGLVAPLHGLSEEEVFVKTYEGSPEWFAGQFVENLGRERIPDKERFRACQVFFLAAALPQAVKDKGVLFDNGLTSPTGRRAAFQVVAGLAETQRRKYEAMEKRAADFRDVALGALGGLALDVHEGSGAPGDRPGRSGTRESGENEEEEATGESGVPRGGKKMVKALGDGGPLKVVTALGDGGPLKVVTALGEGGPLKVVTAEGRGGPLKVSLNDATRESGDPGARLLSDHGGLRDGGRWATR